MSLCHICGSVVWKYSDTCYSCKRLELKPPKLLGKIVFNEEDNDEK